MHVRVPCAAIQLLPCRMPPLVPLGCLAGGAAHHPALLISRLALASAFPLPQCGKFQPLEDFDGDKRSCRARLDKHNARRRRQREMAHMLKKTGTIDEKASLAGLCCV